MNRTLKVFYESHTNLYKDLDDFMTNLYGDYIIKCDNKDSGYFGDFLIQNDELFEGKSQILSLLMGDVIRVNKHNYKLEPMEGKRFISHEEYEKLYDMLVDCD